MGWRNVVFSAFGHVRRDKGDRCLAYFEVYWKAISGILEGYSWLLVTGWWIISGLLVTH